MNNQLCKEPGAGKLHAGFCRGVSLVRGLSTQPNVIIFFITKGDDPYKVKEDRRGKNCIFSFFYGSYCNPIFFTKVKNTIIGQ